MARKKREAAARRPHEKFSPAQVIAALEASAGIRLGAAQVLRCSPTTVTNYVERYPDVKAALAEILENRLDIAEGVIIKRIADDRNPAVQSNAAQFYLKMMGASRGYGAAPRVLKFKLPDIDGVEDVPRALSAIRAGVTNAEITPEQGRQLSDLVDIHRRALVDVEHDARLVALERTLSSNAAPRH
ncbi:hypothetical protein GIW81_02065 [Hyphomicrobium sp. xq]|uniref:Uncharacterized protein n=1 Tax=Hyphomicrobium album TaxID=2665159 RepID=A0A6I3KCF5_9HYPH|nr:hypothetical protein [Hyphomicrobium album]MTD93115.1 hypothetical protein [Hyphomicrobium album]